MCFAKKRDKNTYHVCNSTRRYNSLNNDLHTPIGWDRQTPLTNRTSTSNRGASQWVEPLHSWLAGSWPCVGRLEEHWGPSFALLHRHPWHRLEEETGLLWEDLLGRLCDKLERSYASKQARFDSWSNLRAEFNLWKNYANLKPDNLIRNRHIITVDNEGKQIEQDMAQDLKLPFNIQVKVTFAKKTFFLLNHFDHCSFNSAYTFRMGWLLQPCMRCQVEIPVQITTKKVHCIVQFRTKN